MNRQRLRPLLATLFATALLNGCSTGRRDGRVTLTIWSAPTGIEEKAFLKLYRRFEQEHPGIVIHNLGGLKEDRLVRAIIAGAPPDLAYLYNPVMCGPLAANRAIQPLDDYFARSGLRELDFLPGAIEEGRYQGRLYAMPVVRDSRGFYWNKAIFRLAGLDPDRPPATMEELFVTAQALTKRSPAGALERLGFQPPSDNALFFCAMGGRLYNAEQHRVTIDCPENVEALRWLVRLVDAMGGHDAVAAFESGFAADDSSQNPLAMGRVAMRIDGEWLAMYMEKFAPNLDYGTGEIPHPAGRPDLANMAWIDGDIIMIPRGAKHRDAAWEFIRWLEQPRQQEQYARALNNLPTLRTLQDSPALTQGSRSRETLGYILRHIAAGSHTVRFFPTLPVAKQYRDTLDNAVQSAELHRKTPEQALADAQRIVQAEFEKYESR